MIQKQFSFYSKANTLESLQGNSKLHIAPVFKVEHFAWDNERENCLSSFDDYYKNIVKTNCYSSAINTNKFAVRSSCLKEDSTETSAAGAYLSLLNITYDHKELTLAIEKVFASYPEYNGKDQVLIQPMINAVLSGVITTKVITDGAPYYTINYDDESGKTDTITSGMGASKTVYIYRNAEKKDFDSERLYSIFCFAKQVEEICGSDQLDIEFCIDSQGVIFLLQVRPLCMQKEWGSSRDEEVAQNIEFITNFLQSKMKPQLHLYGKSTILGCMPDWNPAEMIGVTPKPLAISMYRYFITQRIWSKAREMMGYKALPPHELMVLLASRPYIDVRLSFNSFLPENLSDTICEKLVNAWLTRLDENPHFHDKIEFEVALTAMNFSFEEDFATLYPFVLSDKEKQEFKEKLAEMTARCMNLSYKETGFFAYTNTMTWSLEAINTLRLNQQNRSDFHIEKLTKEEVLSYIVLLADECKDLGTLAFSVIARHAFIAESLLRSAIKQGALTKERVNEFKYSIKTVSGIMSEDFQKVQAGSLSAQDFLEDYGHLRPSTYDILSSTYANRKEIFEGSVSHTVSATKSYFNFTEIEKKQLVKLLTEAGLPNDITNFTNYIAKAIAGREYAKFVFTRNISDIIELIARFGEILGLDREVMSYLDIRDVMEWESHALLEDPKKYFMKLAEKGKESFISGRLLKLGYLIRSPRDIYVVPQHRNAPNFVGKGNIEGKVKVLSATSSCSENLDNCIVCIESADPGFDWIFTRPILGLVTKFGGTNSHMAIRCAEYGLPAAIGVGELLFTTIANANNCILNVEENVIIPL